ncbi:MAG: four helix bundle protein [Gemmatimonadota bacterium]|nr:four helix bundle protein [Gemmatimonadota bacterium]
MSDFKKLHVWQKAHALSLSIDRMCKRIRGAQYASLRSQIFRAAMSIPANIAEGRSKNSDKDFGRFLGYALSSCSEVEHHLIVARDTKVIPESDFVSSISQTITVRKMLYGLRNRLSVPERDSKARRSTPQKGPQPKAGPPTAPGG